MNSHKQDIKLAKRLIKGQTIAFNEFFDGYHAKLFRFILSRVNGDHDLAMDLAQDSLCKALDHIADYRGEAALFTWMCQISRSLIYAHINKQKRRSQYVVPMGEHPDVRSILETVADDDQTQPDQLLAGQRLKQLIEEILDHLPNQYGDLLTWKYVDDNSVEEIAEKAGTTLIAAQSALARARKAFQEAMTKLIQTEGLQDLNLAVAENHHE